MTDRQIRELQQLLAEIRQLQENIRRLRQENQELKAQLRAEADLHGKQPRIEVRYIDSEGRVFDEPDEPVAGTA